MFKLGDKVRRVRTSGNQTTPVGYEGVIREIEYDPDTIFRFDNGAWGYDDEDAGWQLVSTAPVRTETVTKRRIVPGVYGRLEVGEATNVPDCEKPDEPARVEIDLAIVGWGGLTATELDDLAMVASQLAEALRDMD